MTPPENLYFIAIVLPQQPASQVRHFQEDLSSRFDSRAALRTEPHITLKPPFKFPEAAHAALVSWFETLTLQTSPFDMELKNFGAFHNPGRPVLYVQPVHTPVLEQLEAEIRQQFSRQFPTAGNPAIAHHFAPHITIGYRDLTPEAFLRAWDEYQTKTFQTSFHVDGIVLFRHTGKFWERSGERRLGISQSIKR